MKRIFALMMIMMLLVGVPYVAAQAGGGGGGAEQPDADGDTIPDEFDACPDQAGTGFNAGCPDDVLPPDADGDTVPDVYDQCPDVASDPSLGGCPDTDGDTFPDNYDGCPNEAGLPENAGCPQGVVPPDADGDTVPDIYDNCPDVSGRPDLGGCPDTDNDFVDDNFDACPDVAGFVQNQGCPIDNPQPTEFDRDGDFIEDIYDGCPDQIGNGMTEGCPEGVLPVDTDLDGVPDFRDTCPETPAGTFDGCPDGDNDQVPDITDLCPNEFGTYDFSGCPNAQYDVTLPAGRAVLTADNAASAQILGQIIFAGSSFVYAENAGSMLLRDFLNGAAIYDDVLAETLTPRLLPLGTGYIADYSADGSLYVEMIDNYETQTISFTLVPAQSDVQYMTDLSVPYPVSRLAVSPNGQYIVTGHGQPGYYGPPISGPAILWDVASQSQVATLEHDGAVTNIAFSPDGAVVATATDDTLILWDIASASEVNRVAAEVNPFGIGNTVLFSPDGALLYTANGKQLTVYNAADLSVAYSVELLTNAPPFMSIANIVTSPDGSLLAISPGIFADGGGPLLINATVSAVSAADGSVVAELDGALNYIDSIAFSPDGTMIIASANSRVLFWGVAQ